MRKSRLARGDDAMQKNAIFGNETEFSRRMGSRKNSPMDDIYFRGEAS